MYLFAGAWNLSDDLNEVEEDYFGLMEDFGVSPRDASNFPPLSAAFGAAADSGFERYECRPDMTV
jgi:hypothetical protein